MASWAYTRHIERTLEAQGGHRMLNFQALEVPSLEIDARIAELRKQPLRLSPREKLVRRIVFALCEYLRHEGFELVAVHDGEAAHPARTTKDAMELIFGVEEATLQVQKPGADGHDVLLIVGNGEDIAAIWSYADSDPDGFNAAMEALLDRIDEELF